MKRIFAAGLLVSAFIALPALAVETLKYPPQAIPVYSVSPGASGSISSSSRSQNQTVRQVPGLPERVSTRSTRVQGSSAVQQSGGIRQSVEYPNGMRVPQQSVQHNYQRQHDQ